MKLNKTILYAKDNSGQIREWSIRSEGKYIYMESGIVGCVSVGSEELVQFGLGGRTLEEQIEMRMNSRINKKLDSGYVYSYEDAKNNVRTNSLGFLKAMKCSRFDEQEKNIKYDMAWVQPKLDGHHCSIINDNGTKIAYSNNGKIIDSIDHILDGFDLPVGCAVEGELYNHGTPLQTISSWVRKKQENSLKLKYFCYDTVSDECYSERYKTLESMEFGASAELLETACIIGRFNVKPILAAYIARGFEGAVIRLAGHPYEAGKRSKGMIKVKPMHFDGAFMIDDEFLVVDIIPSKDGWAILICETEKGVQFRVSCFGTMEYKKEVYLTKNDFIGRHVSVEYSAWTNDKKPFHPVARRWREKFDE